MAEHEGTSGKDGLCASVRSDRKHVQIIKLTIKARAALISEGGIELVDESWPIVTMTDEG